MYPTVCIGPPFPWMNPAAHGTKHCQRYRPFAGVRNVKETVTCASLSGQGALAHRFFALALAPGSGMERPIWGIAKVWAGAAGLTTAAGLPSKSTDPTVPAGCAKYGLRSPVAVSYW